MPARTASPSARLPRRRARPVGRWAGRARAAVVGVAVLVAVPQAGCDSSATFLPPPAAPEGLTVRRLSAAEVAVEWTAASAPERFELERSVDGGAFTLLATPVGQRQAHADHSVGPGRAYEYRVRACDGDLCSAFAGPLGTTMPPALAIATPSLPTGVVGEPYEALVEAVGGADGYTWELVSGALPAGVTLGRRGDDAVLAGTPEAEGESNFTLRVASQDGQYAQAELGIDVEGPTVPASPTGLTVRVVSSTELEIAWAASTDPARFELERAVDERAFEPLASPAGHLRRHTDRTVEPGRDYRYRIRACGDGPCSDFAGPASVATAAVLRVTTASLPDGRVGEAYQAEAIATGGDDDYRWALAGGSLPAGLTLAQDGPTAVLSGTPTAAGTATFTLRVTSGDGQSTEAELAITVAGDAPRELPGATLPPALVGGAYSVSPGAAAGDASIGSWRRTGGSLPPGLSLVDDRLEGSPNSSGSWTFTLAGDRDGERVAVEFSLAAVAAGAGFDITPYVVSELPAGIEPHLEEAIGRWERAITGNLPTAMLSETFFAADQCGGYGDAVNGVSADDVIMIVRIEPIDGEGGTLGQAGPCAIRGGSALPFVGVLTLDSEDLDPLVGSSTLTSLIFHEMGHVLGYGTLWGWLDLTVHESTDSASYTGAGAMAEYQALGRSGPVPLETEGGDGTVDSHWSEAVFNREVMTGYSEAPGVAQPLSRVTIAAMRDLGYTVDLGAADAFSLGSALVMGDRATDRPGHDVTLLFDVRVLEPDGSARDVDLRRRR